MLFRGGEAGPILSLRRWPSRPGGARTRPNISLDGAEAKGTRVKFARKVDSDDWS